MGTSSQLPLENIWLVQGKNNIAARVLEGNVSVAISSEGDTYTVSSLLDGVATSQNWMVEYVSSDKLLISGFIDDIYGFVITVGGQNGLPGVLGIIYGGPSNEDDPGSWDSDATGPKI